MCFRKRVLLLLLLFLFTSYVAVEWRECCCFLELWLWWIWISFCSLDAYIYDYLLKRNFRVSARAFMAEAKVVRDSAGNTMKQLPVCALHNNLSPGLHSKRWKCLDYEVKILKIASYNYWKFSKLMKHARALELCFVLISILRCIPSNIADLYIQLGPPWMCNLWWSKIASIWCSKVQTIRTSTMCKRRI